MRLGPGKHLKGRTLMGGIVKPEEVSVSPLISRRYEFEGLPLSMTISTRSDSVHEFLLD